MSSWEESDAFLRSGSENNHYFMKSFDACDPANCQEESMRETVARQVTNQILRISSPVHEQSLEHIVNNNCRTLSLSTAARKLPVHLLLRSLCRPDEYLYPCFGPT
jgi:hypothetical protein